MGLQTGGGGLFLFTSFFDKLTKINAIGPSFAIILCCVVFIFALIKWYNNIMSVLIFWLKFCVWNLFKMGKVLPWIKSERIVSSQYYFFYKIANLFQYHCLRYCSSLLLYWVSLSKSQRSYLYNRHTEDTKRFRTAIPNSFAHLTSRAVKNAWNGTTND